MVAEATGTATNEADGKAKPKRKASTKLTPVKTSAKDDAAEKPAPGKPTREQVDAWNALPKDQKEALREREAARVFGLAAQAHQNGELDEAVKGYGKALLLNPRLPDAYNNMGVALRAQGKLEASVACYRRSLVLKPENAGAYSNLGNTLRELGRLQSSIAAHQQAIRITPDSADAHYNLALALRDMNRTDQALAVFEQTLKLKGDHVDCRWDRALCFLQKGDFKRGFDEYEWRWKLERSPPRGFEQPLWDGSELKGKTILIHQEQGFGDMIQFARYVPMVKAKGGTVVVEVQPELARLFSVLDGVDKVVNKDSPLPKFDVYVPMISLARIFGTTPETVPADIPYLSAPDAHAVQLPASLGKQRKIGISWAGRPTHQNDKFRSIAFRQFVELLGVPGATIYGLQKGPMAAEVAENGCEALVLNLGGRLHDFADTAAVVAQLDLVISVDTALVHLAGALGKPVWNLLPFSADWRWQTSGDTSPWYPSMRLFRQDQPGNWEPVFEAVRDALLEEMK